LTTDAWNVDTDGSWPTAGDWSEKHAPLSGEDVVIATADPHVVTFNGAAAAINSLSVGDDTLEVASGTLTIAGAAGFGGLLNVDGGTLAFNAAATTIADFTQSAGAVNVKSGTLSFDGPNVSLGGKIVGAGAVAIAGGVATITSGAAITVASLAVSGSGTQLAVDISGLGIYAGGFTLGAGATVTLGGGQFALTGAATTTGGSVGGGGQLITSANVTLSGLTIGGTVNWVDRGKVTQTGGDLAIGDSSGAAAALTIAASGVYAIADDSGIDLGANAASTIYNFGTFGKTAMTGASVVAVDVRSSGTLEDLVSGGGLELDGARNYLSGTYIGPGMIDYGKGTIATLGDLNITQGSCGTNFGTVDVTGRVTIHDGSTLVNTWQSNWNFVGDVGLALATGSSDPSFTNYGVMAKLSGTGTSVIAIDAENAGSGVVSVYSGTLAFEGASNEIIGLVAGKGEFELSGGGATTIGSGAKFAVAKFAIEDAGTSATLDANISYYNSFALGGGATIDLNGAYLSLVGASVFNGGIVDGSSTLYTMGASTVSGLAIGGTVKWLNEGTATQTGGDVAIGDSSGAIASLNNTSKGVYDIVDDSDINRGASTSSYISNAGWLEKTGGSSTSAIAPNIANAGVILAASGALDIEGSLSGAGRAEVGAGATLALGGAVASAQTLVFSGSGGEIALEDLRSSGAQIFHGAISGFGTGDSLAIGAATFGGFAESVGGASGILTLHVGSTSASITMLGDYAAANFSSSLVNGQTVLTYQANTGG
jgi:hypothetical protein